jgi:pyruvate/2-oxoglutarate dehydrogenase complex dihydrolipoamide dehydrogenase (E3) component
MTHHDLIVVGTGSGNRVIDDSFAALDVAIVEQAQRFGGTCLNVGCFPTKTLWCNRHLSKPYMTSSANHSGLGIRPGRNGSPDGI